MIRALVVPVAMAGCSFFTMRSPHGSPPQCEESRTSPLVDTIVTVAVPFIAYGIVTNVGNTSARGIDRLGDGLAAIIIGSTVMEVTGASAVYGFVKASHCERAKRDYQQLMSAPPPGPVPAPPP